MSKTPKQRRRSNRIPKHRRHATGQGIVTLASKDYYTGVWGTAKSEAKYKELIGEWIANDRKMLPAPKRNVEGDLGPSVAEICVRFLAWARPVYVEDDGSKRHELVILEQAAKLLSDQYGLIPAATFSGKHYFELRDRLIRRRLVRGSVNNLTSRVRTVFSWAANRELVPFEVAARLKAIPKLKPGEEGVRETKKVEPVTDEVFEATLPYLRPQLQAFLKLQRLNGCRSGELCVMRPCDLSPTDNPEVVVYRPSRFKTQRFGGVREIFIGPKGRALLAPWLKGVEPEAFVFRKTRKKIPLDSKDVAAAVALAIARAAKKKVLIPKWFPHMLRHRKLTDVRRDEGADVAQLVAGHSSLATTQRYAAADAAEAVEAAKKRG